MPLIQICIASYYGRETLQFDILKSSLRDILVCVRTEHKGHRIISMRLLDGPENEGSDLYTLFGNEMPGLKFLVEDIELFGIK